MNPGYIGAGLVKGQEWAALRRALLCCACTGPRVRMRQRPLNEQREPPAWQLQSAKPDARPARPPPARRQAAPSSPRASRRCSAPSPSSCRTASSSWRTCSWPRRAPLSLETALPCSLAGLPLRRCAAAHPISATPSRTLACYLCPAPGLCGGQGAGQEVRCAVLPAGGPVVTCQALRLVRMRCAGRAG